MTADWDARGLPHADVVLGGTDPARLIRCENAHGAARCAGVCSLPRRPAPGDFPTPDASSRSTSVTSLRSEEHTSELQSLMRTSYAVFCLKKKTNQPHTHRQLRASLHRT